MLTAQPSAAHLVPRAFSTGAVDSLGEGFVWINLLLTTGEKGSMVPTISTEDNPVTDNEHKKANN